MPFQVAPKVLLTKTWFQGNDQFVDIDSPPLPEVLGIQQLLKGESPVGGLGLWTKRDEEATER